MRHRARILDWDSPPRAGECADVRYEAGREHHPVPRDRSALDQGATSYLVS